MLMTFLPLWRRNKRLAYRHPHVSFWGCQNIYIGNSGHRASALSPIAVGPCRPFSSKRIRTLNSEKVVAIRWELCHSAPPTNKVICICFLWVPFSPNDDRSFVFSQGCPCSPLFWMASHPINYLSLNPSGGKWIPVPPLPLLYYGKKRISTV